MSPTPPTPRGASGASLVRKVRACTACRSLKIKCRMPDNGPPCERCRSRTLQCRVDRNFQSLIDESDKWRKLVSGDVSQLRTAVDILLRMADLPPLTSYDRSGTSNHVSSSVELNATEEDSNALMQPAPIATPSDEFDTDIYAPPINSLYQLTRMPNGEHGMHDPTTQDTRPDNDFISRRCIDESTAEHLFRRFVDRFDHFCYDIMCPHETLDGLRRSSTLLTAAVCTVSALHDPDRSVEFTICHRELLNLLPARLLTYRYSTDDLRALIVASYWLGNISYTLVGHAIRTATILSYHQAYLTAIQGDAASFEKARLCDHRRQPGTPPTVGDIHPERSKRRADVRMSSQVALYHILAKVKDIFGTHSTQALPDHCLSQLRGYFCLLDRWYMTWGNRMKTNPYVGNFPIDGAILHYHFARLHLCSYIFRGITTQSASHVSEHVKEYAGVAVSSATAVLELMLERTDLRQALVGMPVYFHDMFTFAAVFLIKAATTNFLGLTTVDANAAFDLLDKCVRELRSQHAAKQHLIYHISRGLEEMVARARPNAHADSEVPALGITQDPVAAVDSLFALDTFDLLQYPLEGAGDVPVSEEYQWTI